jgi:hypothetical protein
VCIFVSLRGGRTVPDEAVPLAGEEIVSLAGTLARNDIPPLDKEKTNV